MQPPPFPGIDPKPQTEPPPFPGIDTLSTSYAERTVSIWGVLVQKRPGKSLWILSDFAWGDSGGETAIFFPNDLGKVLKWDPEKGTMGSSEMAVVPAGAVLLFINVLHRCSLTKGRESHLLRPQRVLGRSQVLLLGSAESFWQCSARIKNGILPFCQFWHEKGDVGGPRCPYHRRKRASTSGCAPQRSQTATRSDATGERSSDGASKHSRRSTRPTPKASTTRKAASPAPKGSTSRAYVPRAYAPRAYAPRSTTLGRMKNVKYQVVQLLPPRSHIWAVVSAPNAFVKVELVDVDMGACSCAESGHALVQGFKRGQHECVHREQVASARLSYDAAERTRAEAVSLAGFESAVCFPPRQQHLEVRRLVPLEHVAAWLRGCVGVGMAGHMA